MTETDSASPPPKQQRFIGGAILCLSFAVLLVTIVFAITFWPPLHDRLLPVANAQTYSPERLADAERKIQTLEARMDDLETRVGNIAKPASPTVTSEQPPTPVSTNDLAHMQNDLATLATNVGNLQDQVKQSNASTRALTQVATAKIIAFLQLRDAANSGRAFARELDAMHAASKTDSDLLSPIDQLAPYAEKGVPDMASLRQQLEEEAGAAELATAKAGAQTWWERMLAELRGLVSIRSLHDAEPQDNALVAMKSALAQNDLAAALEAMKGLPPEAQKTLENWRKQAEARNAIADALRAIADHLATATDAPSTPSGQDKDTP